VEVREKEMVLFHDMQGTRPAPLLAMENSRADSASTGLSPGELILCWSQSSTSTLTVNHAYTHPCPGNPSTMCEGAPGYTEFDFDCTGGKQFCACDVSGGQCWPSPLQEGALPNPDCNVASITRYCCLAGSCILHDLGSGCHARAIHQE
jgi:hypothetical protein